MVKIHIKGNLYLTSSKMSWDLCKMTKDNEGNDKFEGIAYFSSMESALNRVADMMIKESDATTMRELIEHVKEVREFIRKFVEDNGF